MKKIRKIVALALATVMMMAMSITAFAEETVDATKSTITVTNIEEGATVTIYQIAEVTAAGEVKVTADWAAKAGYEPKEATLKDGKYEMPQMDADDALALKAALPTDATGEKLVAENGSVKFVNLDKGAYFITIVGQTYVYTSMVAVTYAIDVETGAYVQTNAEVVAKGTKDDLTKTVKEVDEIVSANQQAVEFTITKEVPSNVTKFILHDKTENLSSLADATVTVKVGETEVAGDWKFVLKEGTTNEFTLDLLSLVKDYAGQTVTITYSADVIGAKGYKNTADYETPGHNPEFDKDGQTTEGFTGRFTLTKTDDKQVKKLANAEFIGTITVDNTVNYIVADGKDGKYTFKALTTDKTKATTFVTYGDEGQFVVDGLDTGVYSFTETKAPADYAVNTNPVTVEIKEVENKSDVEGERVYLFADSIKDSKLATLPFTGGMGTTIFTVLGVAIMAMAAALYFATKKKATK